MNIYTKLVTAFIIYMISMVVSLIAIPSILSQGYVVGYVRPYQLMAFADIVVILGFLIAYLISGVKTLLYVALLALSALIPISYLDVYTRMAQGVRISILPLFIRIEGPSGPSLSIDLAQVAMLALAIILVRNSIKGKKQQGIPGA